MRQLHTVGWLVVLLLLMLWWKQDAVWADVGPHLRSGWYLPMGINLGAGIHPHLAHGFLLGGEVSAVYLNAGKGLWMGGYGDALWDFGSDTFRFGVGPEFGWGLFGLDVGYMADIGASRYRHGLQLRGLITLGFVAVYGRWCRLFGDAVAERNFGEVGLLMKFPLQLSLQPYRPRLYRARRPASGPTTTPASRRP